MKSILVLLAFLSSCSSVKQMAGVSYESKLIDTKVHSSATTFEAKTNWKFKPQLFGEKKYKTDQSWFFSVSSLPSINQRVACSELNDSLKARLAKHFIDFLKYEEDDEAEWVLYLDEILKPKFEKFFAESRIRDTAWEYGVLGDEETSRTFAFVCYALVEIPKQSIKELLTRTGQHLHKRYPDVEGLKATTEAWNDLYSDYHTQEF